MSKSASKDMSTELRRELEGRLNRAIGEGLDKKVEAMRRRSGGGAMPKVLNRLDIEVPEPAKIETGKLHRDPRFPQYSNIAGGQITHNYWVYPPPFDFTARNQGSDGDPDQLTVLTNDPAPGDLNLALHIVNHNSLAWGFAGVGSWYVPRVNSPAAVSFNGLLSSWRYTYTLQVGDLGKPSHARGEIGVRVFSWNKQAEDEQEQTKSIPLWDYGVTAWEDQPHIDGGEGENAIDFLIPVSSDRHYAFCAYIFAGCDATGYPGGSQATVDFWGHVPFLVTDEWAYS
jgi:hypothetical protein